MALLPIYLPAQGNTGNRKLLKTDYPLASMLHWRPATSVPRLAQREWLRALALVGALRFCKEYAETDRFSRVSAGLRLSDAFRVTSIRLILFPNCRISTII